MIRRCWSGICWGRKAKGKTVARNTITAHDIRYRNADTLVGIAVENAVLDIVTNDALMRACLKVLSEPQAGLVSPQLGTFGPYAVTLNVQSDDTVSVFIDGPEFDPSREQCSAIWLGKEELRKLLTHALEGRNRDHVSGRGGTKMA